MQRMLACAAALALGAAAVLSAQSAIAVKGGLSYGNVSNRGFLPGNLDSRTGFALGLSFGAGRNMLGFGFEGLYAQRGVISSSSPPAGRKLDYIDVPVFVRALFPSPGIAPYAYAGPQVSSSCAAVLATPSVQNPTAHPLCSPG
jgi:hypothetical protein